MSIVLGPLSELTSLRIFVAGFAGHIAAEPSR